MYMAKLTRVHQNSPKTEAQFTFVDSLQVHKRDCAVKDRVVAITTAASSVAH